MGFELLGFGHVLGFSGLVFAMLGLVVWLWACFGFGRFGFGYVLGLECLVLAKIPDYKNSVRRRKKKQATGCPGARYSAVFVFSRPDFRTLKTHIFKGVQLTLHPN